jgi:creatinine amidohydrolase
MLLEDLSWFDVEKYLEKDDRLILVLGACEQHGYLSLLTDVKIPLALAVEASKKTGVLVAPPVNFGISPYFLAYPGTISLRTATLMDLIEDLVRSTHRQGFGRFLILNGHGGNIPARSRLLELANHLSSAQFLWYDWWQSENVRIIAKKYGLDPYHANWLEAFSFTRVGDLPQGEKTPPPRPGILNAEQTRRVYGDGVFGGYYLTEDEEVLEDLFEVSIDEIVHLLTFE